MSNAIFNFHDSLLLATTFQSLIFVFLIAVIKKDLHLSDYFLIGFFLAQAAIPVHLLILYGDVFRVVAVEQSPHLFQLFDIAYWIEGPLLLWYTRSLLYIDFKLHLSDILYVFPAVFYIIYSLTTFHSWEVAEQINYIDHYLDLKAPSVPHLLEATRGIIFVCFAVMSLIEVYRARNQVHHRYSNIEKDNFAWLAILIIAFIILRVWILLIVVIAFIEPHLDDDLFDTLGLSGNYLMFLVINVLIFFSITRSAIFAGKLSRLDLHSENEAIDIDPELTERIQRHMDNGKPYLNHYLNLDELANQLSMHPRALSMAIKHNFNTNFYEFINSYRIDESKRLFQDSQYNYRTIIEILSDAGFNSKATFNSIFKKTTGMTPTQYRRSIISSE